MFLKKVDKKHTDVILLDVMMPGMDGFEACKILKSQAADVIVTS